MMPINVLGFQSYRDDFAFAFERSELEDRILSFMSSSLTDEETADKFFPPSADERPEARDRRLESVSALRARVAKVENVTDNLALTSYFPFDDRWCFYHRAVVDRPRRELMQNVYHRQNVCLNSVRQTRAREWRHAFVTGLPTTPLVVETKDGSNVFPLFLYPSDRPDSGGQEMTENFSSSFRAFIDTRYDHHYTPEEILGYLYAALHAPAYRRRYAEFLRIDFPRIPFPNVKADFDRLKKLGTALVDAHLLRKLPRKNLATYHGKGSHEVEAVRYSPQEQAVWINKTQHFAPVPEDVWTFHIGGYQVLDKYLKSRKGRVLSLDEIEHVSAVADALAFTIAQMAEIDAAYTAAFPGSG
jgi:predicted helicase